MDIDDILDALDEFLNVDLALSYCMDDPDVYFEVLKEYASANRRAEAEEAYASSNWEDYRVFVHAIKSSSLTIGAEELSDRAKSLETAAKNSDEQFIRANHASVMEEYQKLVDSIMETVP